MPCTLISCISNYTCNVFSEGKLGTWAKYILLTIAFDFLDTIPVTTGTFHLISQLVAITQTRVTFPFTWCTIQN